MADVGSDERRDDFFLRVDLAVRRRGRLYSPGRADDTIAVERKQAREQAWPGRFRRRLQREHLHTPLAHLEVIAVPCNGALDDLPVHADIPAELVTLRPFLKVEKIAEELERFVFANEPQTTP